MRLLLLFLALVGGCGSVSPRRAAAGDAGEIETAAAVDVAGDPLDQVDAGDVAGDLVDQVDAGAPELPGKTDDAGCRVAMGSTCCLCWTPAGDTCCLNLPDR